MPLISVDPQSLVGRIHELVGELHANGRMSCADASLIHALTWHPDLPQFFKEVDSSPVTKSRLGNPLMPGIRSVTQNNPVTVNVVSAGDPKATGEAVARAIRQHDRASDKF